VKYRSKSILNIVFASFSTVGTFQNKKKIRKICLSPPHPPMTTTQNKTDIKAMDSCESEDEWVDTSEVDGLLASTPVDKRTSVPAAKRIKTKHSRSVSAKLHLSNCGYLPTVLINPCRPAVKKIKTEYNKHILFIRRSIPDAYHKITTLNYKIRKTTASAEISIIRSEIKKNHAIILKAQCQMRAAHQEKKTKLEYVKTHAVFDYLTSKEKRAAKVAIFHKWSPSSSTIF